MNHMPPPVGTIKDILPVKKPKPLGCNRDFPIPCTAWSHSVLRGYRGECTREPHLKGHCNEGKLHYDGKELVAWTEKVGEEKRAGPPMVTEEDKTLVVGDSGFMWSEAIVRKFPHTTLPMVSTVFESQAGFGDVYGTKGAGAAEYLSTQGVLGIGYGITPTKESAELIKKKFGKFDCIVFNEFCTRHLTLVYQNHKEEWDKFKNDAIDGYIAMLTKQRDPSAIIDQESLEKRAVMIMGRKIIRAAVMLIMKQFSCLLKPRGKFYITADISFDTTREADRIESYFPFAAAAKFFEFDYLAYPLFYPFKHLSKQVLYTAVTPSLNDRHPSFYKPRQDRLALITASDVDAYPPAAFLSSCFSTAKPVFRSPAPSLTSLTSPSMITPTTSPTYDSQSISAEAAAIKARLLKKRRASTGAPAAKNRRLR